MTRSLLPLLGFLLLLPRGVLAEPQAAAACGGAVVAAEHARALPARLLTTISLVESGRVDPGSGRVVAWPWTINAGGIGFFYDSKAEAVAAARAMHQAGVASIDVGCMQISLLFHPDAFASLEEAFDPAANAAFGARFLAALYGQTGNWPAAAAAYHSQTPEIGAAYQQRVMALWPLAAKFPPLPAEKAPPSGPDLSAYTPEFRAVLRRQQEESARLVATYGARPADPAPARQVPPPRLLRPVPMPQAPIWQHADGREHLAQFSRR